MKVSRRQRHIIELLLDQREGVTAAWLAEELQVSTRTIHRELPEVELVLEGFGVVLQKKAGTGIQILAHPETLEELRNQIKQMDTAAYTTDERKTLILCKLLDADEPIKLFALSHELQVAVPTISSDLDEIEPWVKRLGLSLIRKRGYGVELHGTEKQRRAAIANLVLHALDDSILFRAMEQSESDTVNHHLLNLVGREHFVQIEQVLWQLDERYPTSLSEKEYTALLIRLSIALTRCKSNRWIIEDEISHGKSEHYPREHQLLLKFTELMNIQLPDAEEKYFTYLFQAWSASEQEQGIIHDDMNQFEFVMKLIQYVGDKFSVPLEQDASLKEDLLKHIRTAFERLARKEPIRNPLLVQIKRDYEPLFHTIREGARKIMKDFPIPDEEVAYLVMHFGAAIERLEDRSLRVKAILVCTSGIGSSKLLAVRIKKLLPQIELLEHVSWYEATRLDKDKYDVVISTVDLPLPEEQYIKLSPLLTNDEAERLRMFVQQVTMNEDFASSRKYREEVASLHTLEVVAKYSQEIVQIIEDFQVFHIALPQHERSSNALRESLDVISKRLYESGKIDQTDTIAQRIAKREQLGSQVIGDSGLALFHTRSNAAKKPSLSLFRFEQPLMMQAGDQEKPVHQALVMLGPEEMERRTIEILSELSAMLLEDDVIRRLAEDEEQVIKQYFSERFKAFIKTKLEWRE